MQDSRSQSRIDALIFDFFAAFDNRDGRVPRHDDVVGCFADAAVIVVHRHGKSEVWSPQEFAAPRTRLLTGGELVNFHEWETSASTQIVGGIATRTSRYSKLGVYNGAPYSGAGTKFFQLAMFPSGWRIVALSWIDDA